MRNKLRRPLAFLLSAVMIVTMSGTPVHAVADRGLDLCQYVGQKKSKDYAVFLSSSSSFCCGVK
ncbi:hypothetical protein D3Z58_20280 [Clostridiaceae bacterium]|nr:hypothetical protein [Clostridiaceae bacterium]